MIRETAPAKVNLYLHVGPRRDDGLHDLASLFVFAGAGDEIIAETAAELSLAITGPFAAPLLGEDPERNLVLRAARALQAYSGVKSGARLTLDKRLPIASGVGGGSADAAAALRALIRLWGVAIPSGDLNRIAFALGADVPACLAEAPVIVSGAGETIEPAPALPPLFICLANPGVAMPTGPIFRDFDEAYPAPAPPLSPRLDNICDDRAVKALLAETRNDLEPFAVGRQSVIQDLIQRLARQNGAIGARMSGSGATVFALFSSADDASRAAAAMAGLGFWSMSAPILGVRP